MAEYTGKVLDQTSSLVLEWQRNPVLAAQDILNVKLDMHQQIVLKSRWTHNTQIDILSRGCGKTFLNAIFAVLRAMLIPGHRVGLIAPSFRQSKMMFGEIEKLYEKAPMFQAACKRPPARTPELCYVHFDSAPGLNGSVIEAMPLGTDGAKIRGARYYDVLADEGAQIDNHTLNTVVRGFLATSNDPMARVEYYEDMERRVAAGLMRREDIIDPEQNKFIISSTAFYQYNHLFQRVAQTVKEILDENKKLIREGKDASHINLLGGALNGGQIPHRWLSNGKLAVTAFTYKDPRKGFMNLKSIEDAKREMSDYTFRMEYEAYFPPDSEGFFRRSDLDACRSHGEFSCLDEPRKGMLYTLGADPARNNDNFAVAIFEIDPVYGTIHLVRIMSWNKKNFVAMHHQLRDVIQKFGIKYFEMDAGGGGTTIRDLFASKENCPVGQKLILEQDFDEHKSLTGERLLGPLIQFSSYEWVHDANHNLLSAIQHKRLKIASKPGAGGELWTPIKEDMDKELEEAMIEWSSIITEPIGSRMRWCTPSDTMRKDRYSAILIGFNAALKVLANHARPKSLWMGGWAQ